MAKGGQTETRSGRKRSFEPASATAADSKSPKKTKGTSTIEKTSESLTEKEISLPMCATITPPKNTMEAQKSFSWFLIPSFELVRSLWKA
mmetsp:Transcript_91074/g.133105  ORF Transcript_91074/g.133105 Transcript_91074/m.133105 type:complete len:90 (+) Transcript_91074:26-295(+)